MTLLTEAMDNRRWIEGIACIHSDGYRRSGTRLKAPSFPWSLQASAKDLTTAAPINRQMNPAEDTTPPCTIDQTYFAKGHGSYSWFSWNASGLTPS